MKAESVASSDLQEEEKATSDLGHERRQQERFACTGPAEAVLDDVAFLFRGTIRNISLTGCYVESSARLMFDRGTAVELRFTLNKEELHLMATIIALRPAVGAGFQFVEVNREMQSRLSGLIRKLANLGADPRATVEVRAAATAEKAPASRDLWR